MLELIGAFVAGVLTTLAPCVLPMLPVIVGGSVAGVGGVPAGLPASRPASAAQAATAAGASAQGGVGTTTETSAPTRERSPLSRALVITGSLGVSILLFTLLLRASTSLLGVPPEVWSWISGGILVLLGVAALFPNLWDAASARLGLQARSNARLASARQRSGVTGEILTGAALGPVFSSCSPLYAYVVATVIPTSFLRGLILLLAYVFGLCGTLLLVALLGQRFVRNARWLADAHGWFRRGLGAVFIVVGVLVATGLDRDFQAWVLENSPVAPWELDSGFIPTE